MDYSGLEINRAVSRRRQVIVSSDCEEKVTSQHWMCYPNFLKEGWTGKTANNFPSFRFFTYKWYLTLKYSIRITRNKIYIVPCKRVLYKCFFFFLERGRERKKHRLMYYFTYLCIHWLITVCALTGDRTHSLGI